MSEVIEKIEEVFQSAKSKLAEIGSADALEQFRIKYLGAKGQLKDLMNLLGQVPREEKPTIGQKVNAVKQAITEAFEAKKGDLSATTANPLAEDVTVPGARPQMGNRHILMKVVNELTELFGRMGFAVAAGPEVEDDFHNFVALNIPQQHPARDPLDNFYLQVAQKQAGAAGKQSDAGSLPGGQAPGKNAKDQALAEQASTGQGNNESPAAGSQLLLRTQTSTVQIRVMEHQAPPIRVVIPGRVYRPDTHDDTHLSMFHQLEALVVDKGVTMVDLKSTILQFVQAYFGKDAQVRFRPSFFPFTEPSAEVDVWFAEFGRWVELGGCGMVHPNVLKSVNVDPEVYTGWAFGFGIERIAMRKYGINNIRLLVENDVRFLKQF